MARVVCCAAPWSVQSTTHVHYRTASQGRAHVLSRVKATALTLRPSTSSAQKRVVRTAAGFAGDPAEGGLGGLGGVGGAIELRSKLEQLDLEMRKPGQGGGWEEVEGAWVKLPPGRAWGCVHFLGGAVLGAFPHIVYDAWLSRVCDEGLIIVATPYELDTNHSDLAAAAAACKTRALSYVLNREGYSPFLPTFAVGHSLGSKLHVLLGCDESASQGEEGEGEVAEASEAVRRPPAYAGHVLVAFNNASAVDTVRLLENFARSLLKKRAAQGGEGGAMFDQILSSIPNVSFMAQRAAQAAGLEFVPNPEETLAMARSSMSSPSVRLVKFKDDDLDMNEELVDVLMQRFKVAYPGTVRTRELEGNHLTPVFIKLQGTDVSPMLSQLGGFNLGDEALVEQLADVTLELIRA